jgi:GNAT superfamily N-acetyltransferase
VTRADAPALADLLNPVIRAGGTTALVQAYTAETLDAAYLTWPTVVCCHVAQDAEGHPVAFQTLGRKAGLPDDIGDIATFAAIARKQSGAGSALFAATRERARALGHSAINATIRADNTGGLAFYARQGFVDHDVTPGVALADGTPVDRVHKRYSLFAPGS